MPQTPIFKPDHPVRRALEAEGIRFLKFLGRGGFNEAWSAEWNQAEICVKISIEPLDDLNGKAAVELKSLECFKRKEIATHAFIVKYFGHRPVHGHLVTFWELGNHTLLDVLERIQAKEGRSGLTWHEVLGDERTRTGYLWSVGQACDDFNNLGHQHRDLKPANLVVFFGNQVKLADLGLATFIGASTHRSQHKVGTVGYQPLEASLGQWNKVSDLYSLCATYIKLRTGHEPFGDESFADVYERQRQGAPLLDGLEPFERGPLLYGLAPRPEDRPQEGIIALLRSIQPDRQHAWSSPGRPFVAPQDVKIQPIEVPPLKVEVRPVQVSPGVMPGLPDIPANALEVLGQLRGLDQAIDALKNGRHPALRPAVAAVRKAEQQAQEMKADLDAHVPKLPNKLRDELAKRVAAEPGGSVAALLRLAPDADPNEMLQYILRLRNAHLSNQAAQDAQAAYQRSAKAEIHKLGASRQSVAAGLAAWQREDLTQIVEQLRKSSGGSRHFPLDAWLAFQPALLARYNRRDPVDLLELAERVYRFGNLQRCQNSIGMEFVEIVEGDFLMGSPEGVGSGDERPQHRVRITKPFLLGKYPVTVGQFRQFVQATGYAACGETWKQPGNKQADDHPVVCVSHDDALAMAKWLSEQESRECALPTEAEWEYACRAGTTTLHYGGDSLDWLAKNANIAKLVGGTTPVGKYAANPWGLHDMLGNCWEWVSDWYDAGYYGRSPSDDPAGPLKGDYRSLRGGSWWHDKESCRSGCRYFNDASSRCNGIGFRLLFRLS